LRGRGHHRGCGRASYSVVARRLTASAVAALACIAIAGCGGSQPHSASGAGSLSNLDVKLPAPAQLRAATPQFTLRDSTGRLVSLSQFRGKAVLLTFIYDHCPDTCPLIVGDLHTALGRLGAKAAKLQIIAVSVDPKGDAPATVKAFLEAHEMTGRMEYLIGSFRELAPVWRAYGVQVQGSLRRARSATLRFSTASPATGPSSCSTRRRLTLWGA
jgi:protein SCO1/2